VRRLRTALSRLDARRILDAATAKFASLKPYTTADDEPTGARGLE
jgi:hypothetical protein